MITHEHVVAMMKVAIRDTQDLPMFVSLVYITVCVTVFESSLPSTKLDQNLDIYHTFIN